MRTVSVVLTKTYWITPGQCPFCKESDRWEANGLTAECECGHSTVDFSLLDENELQAAQ